MEKEQAQNTEAGRSQPQVKQWCQLSAADLGTKGKGVSSAVPAPLAQGLRGHCKGFGCQHPFSASQCHLFAVSLQAQALLCSSKFEAELKAEQDERKREEEARRLRQAAFRELRAAFSA